MGWRNGGRELGLGVFVQGGFFLLGACGDVPVPAACLVMGLYPLDGSDLSLSVLSCTGSPHGW